MIPLHTRATCDVCGDPATVEFEGGFFLCSRCDTIKQREFPQSAAPLNSGIDIPPFLRRDQNNVPPFARSVA